MTKKTQATKSKSTRRIPVPAPMREEMLRMSRRRCCMCFGLEGDASVKEGQLAHLDRNRSNPTPNNLAFLCQECHTQYDRKSNRVLGFTPDEVRYYRDRLYEKLGHDRIEWNLTMRVHRKHYAIAREVVDEAKAVLLGFSRDVTVQEGPADLK